VIVQTANAMPEDKIRAEEAGCDDFVTKPINRKELLAKLNSFFT
jgi:two-component system sensor histidine kinase/response regulator